jgi:hypothetical protein
MAGEFTEVGLLDLIPGFDLPDLELPSIRKVNDLTAMYNTVPLHARPLAINFVSNTLLNYLEVVDGQEEGATNHSITVTNHPLDLDSTVSCPSDNQE